MNQDEQEVRDAFAQWFRDAAAKDLDAVMARIADDAVSYEHEAPLVYQGVDAIREVCRRGFEIQRGDFRWDIPDLQVIVRGDIAVTWGVNHLLSQEPGQEKLEMWSRGTRVFQKVDGAWRMIHQHVSFPFDPATGQVSTTG
jgi:uncharacterized protein (TIGR02246 family)